jgi:hypothetical protein
MPEGIEKVASACAGGENAIHNMNATSAPAVTDDASKGYSTLSVWFKKNTSDWWHCTDATTGAAVWEALE